MTSNRLNSRTFKRTIAASVEKRQCKKTLRLADIVNQSELRRVDPAQHQQLELLAGNGALIAISFLFSIA
jgi:hypothetical protein